MSLLSEQLSVKTTPDKTVVLNGQEYQLMIKTPLGWSKVNIDELKPTNDGWKIRASFFMKKKEEIIPNYTIKIINSYLGKSEIELGGNPPKKLIKVIKNNMMENLNEKNLNSIIKRVLKEHSENYMFFSNLEQIKRQCEMMLEMNEEILDMIIQDGHDWADDHISEAKTNIDQVFDFFMNEGRKRKSYAEFEDLQEGRKKQVQNFVQGVNQPLSQNSKFIQVHMLTGMRYKFVKGKCQG